MPMPVDNPDNLLDSHPDEDAEHFHSTTIAKDVDAKIAKALTERIEKVIEGAIIERIESALKPGLHPRWFYVIIIILGVGLVASSIFLISRSLEQAEQMNGLIEAIEGAVTDK